jgi:hypothetical protein
MNTKYLWAVAVWSVDYDGGNWVQSYSVVGRVEDAKEDIEGAVYASHKKANPNRTIMGISASCVPMEQVRVVANQ